MMSHWLDYSALQQYDQFALSALHRWAAPLKADNFISNSSLNFFSFLVHIRNSHSEMSPPSAFTFFFSPTQLCISIWKILISHLHFGESSRWLLDIFTFFLQLFLPADDNHSFLPYMCFPQKHFVYLMLFSPAKLTMLYSLPAFFDTRFQFKTNKINMVITEDLTSFSFFSFLFESLWISVSCSSLEALVPLMLSTYTHKQIKWHRASVVFVLVASHQLAEVRQAPCRDIPAASH